ncbi:MULTISPECIES: helix-turn-helix transcriptional regulator [unclassified Mesorhizobium]|uniref:helix-turn-helix transcriptional regulator n=1 Tax=unclassified Mesorhizobium TaxID=325217 RepID=UPI000FCC936A|nr:MULTISPECIES: helix-turn-helix transcriptional regulator [unclassified Mesorhizobium]RUX02718.1 helix-turn-helix transcriptional regulator [Mesorhizobium sp. M8A.F.Ca.ET.059.01.1.1]RUX03140.1 helix-turn-helix transcriptional regulator [Mesorhizobium sp. M8A.F.Ca.ET.023.01.1.1]TGR48796.1 helix-turn-helix transcriptional regulator [bacterium M00.F.Ca.ET.199.01.1.1]TGU37837.1 helix-turn-helix transcriptional regulator [bacterium M00.F.Ca.ET.156.01.1.1]TGU96777.1 helix-turn-helix transcriptiona
MKHADIKDAAEALFNEQRSPFGAFSLGSETHHAVTIPDAVRRCRWISVDINASAFGLFFVSPSPERARLVPCFDSDYPGTAVATKFISGANGEEIVRHSRISTEPRWWTDDGVAAMAGMFGSLAWTGQMAPLTPGSSGIAFPVHADRGQCGLVVFLGSEIALPQDALYEIHARCFSLFAAVARMRPGDAGRMRSISKRELECLKLTANGNTSEEIARLLKLSVHTANQYLTQSTQKLNAVNRNQAVAKALRLGLIE